MPTRLIAKTTRILTRSCLNGPDISGARIHTDPIGSSVVVYGFSDKGVYVELPFGGYGHLGRLDICPCEPPTGSVCNSWKDDDKTRLSALPEISIKLSDIDVH